MLANFAVISLEELAGSLRLDEPALDRIADSVTAALRDVSVSEIRFRGGPRGFLEGVDRAFFTHCLAARDIDRIMRFTAQANDLLTRIARSPKRSIAWIEGSAMGGGVEIALACRSMVAIGKARFCFPEVGLGIMPGMGGTQRLPRRIGLGLAKWMIYTGSIVPAAAARDIGLIDCLLPAGADMAHAWEAPFAKRAPFAPDSPWRLLERFFTTHGVADLLDPRFPQPADPRLVRPWFAVKQKPRLALEMAEQAIDQGYAAPLDAGLAIELAKLPTLFQASETLALLRGEQV